MADGAAHLVDHVLPFGADYRQWTLSFPRWLRIRLLRDKALVSKVLLVFVRIVSAYHRRRARERGVACGETGAVTAIQLAGSFVNANVHFHTLVPEGAWHEQPDGSVAFHPLPPPTDEDVEVLAVRIVRRVVRLLARRDADAAVDDALDGLDQAQAEAVQLPMTLSEPRLGTRATTTSTRRRCALVDGFSLHANTSVECRRPALERLTRYLLRPMISADRLTVRPDGRVEYHFRRPDPTGRTSWVTDGPSWCRRLATLIPPRRSHTTRFHGVLSSAHRWRARGVPTPPPAAEPATPPTPMLLARRLDWASLLRRVFGEDVTQCPRCGDRLGRARVSHSPRPHRHHPRSPRARFGRSADRSGSRPACRRRPRVRARLRRPLIPPCRFASTRAIGPVCPRLEIIALIRTRPYTGCVNDHVPRLPPPRAEPGAPRPPHRNPASTVLSVTELAFTPIDFLRRLATLIPPPRSHLTRYHGVFAANHHLRAAIVPAGATAATTTPPCSASRRRLDWASLLKRVFAADVLVCDSCGGAMRILAVLPKGDASRAILEHLGLPTEPPPPGAVGPPEPVRDDALA
jgi:hypothetical protein